MWPITVSELATILTGVAERASAEALPSSLLESAIGWAAPAFAERDVFFALSPALHDLVPEALAGGAIAVVSRRWTGITRLTTRDRIRCFVADEPLVAYRKLAAWMRARFPFPVIAVGGSNGKTTTKEMIATLLRVRGRAVTATPGTNNGWVGIPITICHPAHRSPPPDALVLEIGIDERGAMRDHVGLARPDIAVLTALGVEHLAGLGTHADVVREELELFAGARRRVWLASDPNLWAHIAGAREEDLVVHEERDDVRSIDPKVPRLVYAWTAEGTQSGRMTLRWEDAQREVLLPLPGAHNGRNAALAIGVALLVGRSFDEMVAACSLIRSPPKRSVIRSLPSTTTVIDDTYNASPASVEAALAMLAPFDPGLARIVVLGDMLDLGSSATALHEDLIPWIQALGDVHVRLFGPQMSALAPRLTAARSVGRALAEVDPTCLVDLPLARAVVLVKGSRGMGLERVVEHLEATAEAPELTLAVAGVEAESFGAALRAGLFARSVNAVVRALSIEDLEAGEALRTAFRMAVITGFVVRKDPDRDLAALAQLVVGAKDGAVVILPRPAYEEDPMAFLAEIVPHSASLRTVATSPRTAEIIATILHT